MAILIKQTSKVGKDHFCVEFENQKNQTIEYKFQVDETSNPRKAQYDVIIGNDLLWNMGINILFKEQEIHWNEDKIPLKTIGQLRSRDTCIHEYSVVFYFSWSWSY